MVKGSKYGKKRGGMRRRGYGKRRRTGIKKVRMVHHFKERFRTSDIIVPATSGVGNVLSCNLQQLTNSTSFINMFDMYKITGIKWTFIYRQNSADTTSGTSAIPLLHVATNRDPFAPPPANVADILNDDSCRTYRMDRPKVSWYVKAPKPDMTTNVTLDGVLQPATVVTQWNYGVSSKFQPWLCTGGNSQALDQSKVPHFGVRYYVDNATNLTAGSIEVYGTLYFSCKEQD